MTTGLSFYFADGVGDLQQSGLCRSHLPQYERLGIRVETGDIFSLQLLAEVSSSRVATCRFYQ